MIIFSTVEIEGVVYAKAESDANVKIRDTSDGRVYDNAVYSPSQSHTFEETDIPVYRGDATEADKDATLRRFGVEV